MNTKKATSILIRFVNGEADELIKFKKDNPGIQHKTVYQAGMRVLSKKTARINSPVPDGG